MPTRKTRSVLVFLVSINAFNAYVSGLFVLEESIARFSTQQSALRAAGKLLAFRGDRHLDVVLVSVELQHDLHGGNPVFGAIGKGLFAGGEISRVVRGRGPLGGGFEVKMVETVLDENLHSVPLTENVERQVALMRILRTESFEG